MQISAPGPPADQPHLVLYIGLDEQHALAVGSTLVEVADAIKDFARELVGSIETHAMLTLAPSSAEAREGPVVIDESARRVRVGGRGVPLTLKEFDLLAYLARRPGRVVSRVELMRAVWHTNLLRPGDRTIDVHVRRLRAKLAPHALITTVRGIGYRFDGR